MDPKPVKGILKKSCNTRSIEWDEDNLAKNESEKVPRMKIDEAKTPFETLSPATKALVSENDVEYLNLTGASVMHDGNNIVHATFNTENIDNELESSESESEIEDEATLEKKRRFYEARKKHYHMQHPLKQQIDTDDESDVSVEDDEAQ